MSLKKTSDTVFIFSAHSDDFVLGAGGTVAKYVQEGKKVFVDKQESSIHPCRILVDSNKDGMPEVARKIEADLRPYLRIFYDDKGAVGRRYRRMDEVGTPFCITVDTQTMEDQTVTVRERDSMEQVRVSISSLKDSPAE